MASAKLQCGQGPEQNVDSWMCHADANLHRVGTAWGELGLRRSFVHFTGVRRQSGHVDNYSLAAIGALHPGVSAPTAVLSIVTVL